MSTLKCNAFRNTASNDGGIDIDASGHVQIDGQQLPTAGPLSNRNLIINGAMQVAQRGTSSSATGYTTVDRWRISKGVASITQTQEALSSGDPYNEGFRNFLRATVTTASSSDSAYHEFQQKIEAQNLAQSGWKYTDSSSYITHSFWARSSLAGTYYVSYVSQDVANLYYNKAFTLSANTWTKVTQTIPGHSSMVINNDAGSGLIVTIVPHYGANFTSSSTAADAWYFRSGADNYLPDYSQNWTNTLNATFDITGVQLEVGEKATPFEHKRFEQELTDCCRYYQKSYQYGTAPGTTEDKGAICRRSSQSTAMNQHMGFEFRHRFRADPSVTIYNPNNGTASQISSRGSTPTTHNSNVAVGTIFNISQNAVSAIELSSAGGPAILFHYEADAEL